MKTLFILLLFCGPVLNAAAQEKGKKTPEPDKNKKVLVVEASCGQCNFKLPGTECDLAIRLDGKAYFVDGTKIDDHGDAHANDGFCNTIRKAKVQGEVVDGRFKATYFQLLPEPAKKEKAN
jgi:hypothetical protein